jgi:hypothetical protein
LVATWDQVRGISTSCCSKTTSPFSFVMLAYRVSHSTSSNAEMPARVKNRFQGKPLGFRLAVLVAAAPAGRSTDFEVDRGMN